MARGQVLLVREDAGVEARHDADVLPQVLVPLGGELSGHAGDRGVRLKVSMDRESCL